MAVLKNLVMRGASQRLGGMVLYQLKGQTLARELAPAVTNPRTPAQMDNRVRLQNVVSVYRANRAWMAGAFENKKERESDYNAFVSANLSSSQVAFTKAQAAAGAAVAAPYQISSGSLGSIEQQVTNSILETNLYLGNMDITPSTTVGEFAAALIANNNNIVQGMQLSLILNIQQVNQVTGIPYIITRAYEVLLNPSSDELLTAYMPGSILSAGAGEGSPLNADLSEQGSGAVSFILSHTVSAITRVSEQSLIQFGSLGVYNSYTSSQAISEAVASYGENQVNFLDSNSAYEQNAVPIQQGISYLVMSNDIVRAGDEHPSPLTSVSVGYRAYMQLPVEAESTISATLYNLDADISYTCNVLELPADGSYVTWQVPEIIRTDERVNMRFVVVINSQIYKLEFILTPAET